VAIQKYPQVEAIEHVHTAGNSSGIVDGAAAVLIGSRGPAQGGSQAARTHPGVRLIGSEPTIMLTGPAAACRKALKRARMRPGDIDLWEINEAFASVVLRFMRVLALEPDR
jgi:acetyl-CoA C-acetyltransferase